MALAFLIPGKGEVNLAPVWTNAGVPSSGAGGAFQGIAEKGDLCSDTTNAQLYICTASSSSSITWAEIAHA
jgi:hypothetical protein